MASRKPLLEVLSGVAPERRPLWFMRQAGRYLPEYRKVREKAGSFVALCYSPEDAAEVTLQPLRRYDLDAAIVFADILVVPHAMGCSLDFREGEGPVLSVVNSAEKVRSLGSVGESWQGKRVQDTLRLVRAGLGSGQALIGFCGAPWTVASYMIEGGTSVDRAKARMAALARPQWFTDLMARLAEASIDYLSMQIEAGAEAVQIFESWAGDVPWPLVTELVVEPIRQIREGIGVRYPDVPVIVFGRGLGQGHVGLAKLSGASAVGVEQGVDLGWAASAVHCPVQGNLDPMALVVGGVALDSAIDRIVAAVPRSRHIFNLGHGIRQETPLAHVEQMVARVRMADSRG